MYNSQMISDQGMQDGPDMVEGWVAQPGGVLTVTSSLYVTQCVALPVADGGYVLVDPGVTPVEVRGLLAELSERGLRVVAVMHTHAHWDHLLWPPGLASDIPRWASNTCIDTALRNSRALQAEAAADVGPREAADLLSELDRLRPLPAEGGVPDVPQLCVVEHQAHTRGHIAVLHEPSGTLCAGDMLSDIELPLPDGAGEGESAWDVAAYLDGLDTLQPLVNRAALVVPGHGNPGTDAAARLANDRTYLDAVLQHRGTDDVRLADASNQAIHAALTSWAAFQPIGPSTASPSESPRQP